MKFASDKLKNVLTSVKRIYKQKKDVKMIIESIGDMRYYISATSEDGSLILYTHMPSEDEDVFKIECNPYEIEIYAKMKKEVVTLVHDKGFLYIQGSKDKVAFQNTDKSAIYSNNETKKVKDKDLIRKIFKSAEITLKSATDYHNTFMKIDDQLGVILLPKELHFYKVRHDMPFDKGYLEKQALEFFNKTIKTDFEMAMDGKYLVFKTEDMYFLCDIKKPVIFQEVKKMKPIKRMYGFKVDANLIEDVLSTYKKEVNRIEITFSDETMIIDPRREGYEKSYIPIRMEEEGEYEKIVFDTQSLRSLIGYHVKEEVKKTKKRSKKQEQEEQSLFEQTDWLMDGETDWFQDIEADKDKIEIEMYYMKTISNQSGIIWRLDTLDKTTWIGGIQEPDFARLDKYYKEGRLKELY